MKSIITILLLANFLVFQYARQLSYWECRLSNYFKTEKEKCDCEKLIKVITGQITPPSIPITHNHFHMDESFYPSAFIAETETFYTCLFSRFMRQNISVNKIKPGTPDRPPNC